MNHRTSRKPRRKGAITVLMAFLAIPLLGMVAFAVDMAWIASTKARLQAAADAAAVSGARQLINGYVLFNAPLATGKEYIISSAETSAKTYAKNFASYNGAGGVDSLTLNDSDIEFGYTSSSGSYSTTLSGKFPNTCKVTLRRDGSANGSLALFFAPVLGISTTAVTATASATIYTGTTVSSFNYAAGINGGLLPVGLDVNVWTTFYATGTSPDGVVHRASNGSPQLQIYPSPGNAPGNFGLVSIGPPATSTPTFSSWLSNGPSPSDLQYFDDNNLVPVSLSSPKAWAGGPGLKSSLGNDFANAMNQSRLLPVFQPVSTSPYVAAGGNGSNSYYNIVGFVGVSITQADGSGSNLNISVQPVATVDPTMNYDPNTVVPAGEGSSTITTFALPKLTQ
ncbi:MAG: pilus assembly protein TadG-related protein [Planctomycetota bacterium]